MIAGFLLLALNESLVIASPPIEEIRTVLSQQDLWKPSQEALSALNAENLKVGLHSIDQFARYILPSSRPCDSINSISLTIGIEIFQYKSLLWMRTDHGGPADRSGIPEITILHAINKKKVIGTNLAYASEQIDRAIKKNWVALTVSRSQDDKSKTYVIIPEKFVTPSVIWHKANGYIIIRIREFIAHDTAPSLFAIYKTVVKPNSRIIIDLRGCSGGDLFESIEIAGMFVPAGLPMISTKNRSGFIKTYKSPSDQKSPSPVFLLIDSRTASSAEIFAGILKYYGLCRSVGERSTGKCVSQTLIPLSNGGGLWLTNFAIHFPDNSSCTGIGIQPDIFYPDIMVSDLTEILKEIND